MPEACGFKFSHLLYWSIWSSILNNVFLRGCVGEAACTELRKCTSVPACVRSCFWISWVRSEKLQWHNLSLLLNVTVQRERSVAREEDLKWESIKSTNFTSCSSVKVRSTLRESRAVQRGKAVLLVYWQTNCICVVYFLNIRCFIGIWNVSDSKW